MKDTYKFSRLMQDYGAGDNSVTDRMWYELAVEICSGISSLDNDKDKITLIAVCIGASTVDPHGTVTNEHVIPFVEPAKKILSMLDNQRLPYTTRISIEYVRQQIEKLLEQKT